MHRKASTRGVTKRSRTFQAGKGMTGGKGSGKGVEEHL